ncbi:MAG: 4-(cytidine 5'-diphospho)-2-C-methyl-D-erythritol kinase [Actinobacteria bacterium]|nr:4-(cytidine 5'-diphospho)-2-C-methyl-D-erythritol kinase [Actinomycetota bacterium]
MTKSVTVRVPGKVNVYLGVGPREFSGYHELATIFQAVGIYDEVTVSAADSLKISGLGAFADQIPTDETNLAWKAAELVARACGEDPNIHIQIDKSIPIAAGMAGGSADAAATLVACDTYWNAGIPRDQLDAMAATLGSDVPFMLHGGCALGVGRGDVLSPVMIRGSFHWVFATFDEGLSTAQIYEKTDELRGLDFEAEPEVPTELLSALARGDAPALGRLLHNDLQLAATTSRPLLGRVLEQGIDYGALGAIVSGSGPTCAFLVRDESSAIDLVVALKASGLVDDVLRTHGPVHGARVISTSR